MDYPLFVLTNEISNEPKEYSHKSMRNSYIEYKATT